MRNTKEKSLIAAAFSISIVLGFMIAPGFSHLDTRLGNYNEKPVPNLLDDRKNYSIILISLDPVNTNRMSCYGHHRNTTPNICEFAEDSYFFRNAYSEATWTLPAYASLFTSYYPSTTGILESGSGDVYSGRLKEDYVTLAEVFKEEGYNTAAFVGSRGDQGGVEMHLNSRYNLDQGFEIYSEEGFYFRRTLPPAKTWLSKNRNESNFLFIQSYNAHPSFKEPIHNDVYDQNYTGLIHKLEMSGLEDIHARENSTVLIRDNRTYTLSKRDVRHIGAEYDGELRYADRRIGNFLDYLKANGMYNDSIIIIQSSHGISFGNRYRGQKEWGLFETSKSIVRVPLMIRIPGQEGGEVETLAQHVDIAPTLFDLVGIKSQVYGERQGESLVRSMVYGESARDYAYTSGMPYASPIIQDRVWKYAPIHGQEYLVKKDFGENTNYYSQRPGVAKRLARTLEDHRLENVKIKTKLEEVFKEIDEKDKEEPESRNKSIKEPLMAEHKINTLLRYHMGDQLGYRVMRANVSGWFDGGFYHTPYFRVRTNSEGLRDTEFRVDKPEGVTRILVVGDSITFGRGVNRSETFTEIVEKRLEKQEGGQVQVINAGIPGYGMKDAYTFLKHRGFKYDPDMVVIAANAGDRVSIDLRLYANSVTEDALLKVAEEMTREEEQQFIKRKREAVIDSRFENKSASKVISKYMLKIINSSRTENSPVLFYITDRSMRDKPGFWMNADSYSYANITSAPSSLWDLPREKRVVSENEWHPSPLGHEILAEGLVEDIKNICSSQTCF